MGNMIKTFQAKIGELGGKPGGKLYCVPTDWGSEAMSFNTKAMNLEYGKASFGDLWDPRWAGKMLCRPRSIMLGVGMWWEGKGEIPAGTMAKTYSDQPTMEKYYGQALDFCIKNKKQIGKWWTQHGRDPGRLPAGGLRDRHDLGRADQHDAERGSSREVPGAEGRRADLGRQRRRSAAAPRTSTRPTRSSTGC